MKISLLKKHNKNLIYNVLHFNNLIKTIHWESWLKTTIGVFLQRKAKRKIYHESSF